MACFAPVSKHLRYICLIFFPRFFFLAVVQISAGFHKVKLGERGGRRRDFNDTGVNTRQAMEHVKYSKAGEWSLFKKILIQMLFFDISV